MSLSREVTNRTGWMASRVYAGLALEMDLRAEAPLPAGGRILAANHPSTLDPFIMMGLLDTPVHILITDMCFEMPLLGPFLRRAGHIPVVAGQGQAAIEMALALLREGKTVGIYPEGELSPAAGGKANPVHSGVARLALASGAPIIPAGIALQPERIYLRQARAGERIATARYYAAGRYAVTLGRPVYLQGDVEDREYVRRGAVQVMEQIMHLAGVSAQRVPAAAEPVWRLAMRPVLNWI